MAYLLQNKREHKSRKAPSLPGYGFIDTQTAEIIQHSQPRANLEFFDSIQGATLVRRAPLKTSSAEGSFFIFSSSIQKLDHYDLDLIGNPFGEDSQESPAVSGHSQDLEWLDFVRVATEAQLPLEDWEIRASERTILSLFE